MGTDIEKPRPLLLKHNAILKDIYEHMTRKEKLMSRGWTVEKVTVLEVTEGVFLQIHISGNYNFIATENDMKLLYMQVNRHRRSQIHVDE